MTEEMMLFDCPYIEDYFGKTQLLLDQLPGQHERWSVFNPSIGSDGAGNLAITFRSSNYRLDYKYGIPDLDLGQIRNRLWFSELDSDLNLVNLRRIEVVGLDHQAGIEDARLFWSDGAWHILAATLGGVSSRRIARLNLFELDPKNSTATFVKSYKSFDADRSEKNWMPVAHGVGHKFDYIHSSGGVVVGDKFIMSGIDDKVVSTFRGGSCLLPLGDGTYLSVVHHTYSRLVANDYDPNNSSATASRIRTYTHRFVRYGSSGSVLEYSPEFYFDGPGVEFAAGMTLLDDELLISYGKDDCSANLARIPLSVALDLLTPITDELEFDYE